MPNKSFTKRITQWMIILAVISVLLFGFFSLLLVNQSTKHAMRLRIFETSNTLLSLLETRIENYDEQLIQLAEDKEVQDILKQQVLSEHDRELLIYRMFGILQADANTIQMHFVSVDEKNSFSTTQLPSMYQLSEFSDWGVLRFAKNRKNHELFANHYIWGNGTKNGFSISQPVYVENILQGYFIMDFADAYLKKLSNNLDTEHLGSVQFIMTSTDEFIIYNNTEYAHKKIRMDTSGYTVNSKFEDPNYTVGLVRNQSLGVSLLGLVHNDYIQDNFRLFTKIILLTLVPSLLVAFLIAFILGRSIVTPILKLAAKVKSADSANLSFVVDSHDELQEIECAFHELLNRIDEYHKIDIEKRERLRIAEVRALQSQINPHFLYNTLDSMKWQAKLNGLNEVAKMATELSKVLKASMNLNETLIPLQKEIELINSYIYIQKQRYSDRFQFTLEIDENMMNIMIPKLILQPLVENAIIHGMEAKSDAGLIVLKGFMEKEEIIFEVIDNGQGFQCDFESMMKDEKRGIGLKNVNRRIKLYYGSEYGLKLDESYREGTKIEVRILKQIGGDFSV